VLDLTALGALRVSVISAKLWQQFTPRAYLNIIMLISHRQNFSVGAEHRRLVMLAVLLNISGKISMIIID